MNERILEPLIPYVLNRLAADVEKMEYEPVVGTTCAAHAYRPKEIGSSISDLSSFFPLVFVVALFSSSLNDFTCAYPSILALLT